MRVATCLFLGESVALGLGGRLRCGLSEVERPMLDVNLVDHDVIAKP
jgi:hypothetical protein